MVDLPPPPVAHGSTRVTRPGRTEGAEQRPDLPERAPRTFPCPQCGADLEYFIGELALRCPHCRHIEPIDLEGKEPIEEQDYAQRLDWLKELHPRGAQISENPSAPGSKSDAASSGPSEEVECASCGAGIAFVGNLTSTRCAYCGTPIQRDRIHTSPERIPVDAVLPFEVDKDAARAAIDRWVSGRWFAPSKFVEKRIREGLQGVYLPYWTFDLLTFTRYRGRRGDHHREQVGRGKNRRTVTRTKWRPAAGKFQHFFDDILSLAAKSVQGPALLQLEPWPLERLQPFRPEFLAGLQARTYDTELEQGFQEARSRAEGALRNQVRARIGGDVQQIDSMDVRLDAIEYKHLLLPVWLLTYRHKGKPYNVVINATTGEVFGERPYSAAKIGCLVALGIAALLLILLVRAL